MISHTFESYIRRALSRENYATELFLFNTFYVFCNPLLFLLNYPSGIKPFECNKCSATFTRLHSLKYHLMIHNEQTRFMCDHCGREFRHSSHFREHLRRHTGEEPFGCTDCPLRFKTRNTYKRHLKAKHQKKLTAKGISLIVKKE